LLLESNFDVGLNAPGEKACWESSDSSFGVCVLDASTSQFECGTVAGIHNLEALLKAVRPHEIISPKGKVGKIYLMHIRSNAV
jgi:DNA mismatch repair ATPase MutS